MNREKRRRMNRILGENEALRTTNNKTPAKDDPQAQVDIHTDAGSIKGPPENPVHHPVPQDLGQVEHFQENAMKAQAVLKTVKNPMDLLLYPGMTEGHAKRFLTAPLRHAVEKVWEHVDPNYLLHIYNNDRTGILRDIMAGLEV
ncbi:MAG: hypothetical protein J3Q66DRAFT_362787 [Benniella sp.]|nr:MAG: hypothetical protein J3Q66DRAFT_362787 [Benniella sp.]